MDNHAYTWPAPCPWTTCRHGDPPPGDGTNPSPRAGRPAHHTGRGARRATALQLARPSEPGQLERLDRALSAVMRVRRFCTAQTAYGCHANRSEIAESCRRKPSKASMTSSTLVSSTR
jgi:hypothetical protein